VKIKIAFLKNSVPNIWAKSFSESCNYSLRRGSMAFSKIPKVWTYPISFRPSTIKTIFLVSQFRESPSPGVSITMTGSSLGLFPHLVRTSSNELVSDSEPPDTLKCLAPQIEFAVVDLPRPVRPIMQMAGNLFDCSSLTAKAAYFNFSRRSSGI
jgi:hypothetical protein